MRRLLLGRRKPRFSPQPEPLKAQAWLAQSKVKGIYWNLLNQFAAYRQSEISIRSQLELLP
jgi:hypothetical protein